MSEASPVSEPSRIKSLDVVRGFALLGILAVNAGYFAAPYQAMLNPLLPPIAVTPDTLWAWMLMHVGFELKMVTLFSMLFGASLYMVGGETDNAERGQVLRRRLAWLVLFGLIHGALIWFGDILLTYALAGMLVMLARSRSPARLLLDGLLVYGLAVVLVYVVAALAPMTLAEEIRLHDVDYASEPEAIRRLIQAYGGEGFSSLQANAQTWASFFFSATTLVFIARTIAMMLVGMALYKWGFFSGRCAVWLYVLCALLGAAALALIAWQAWINIAAGYSYLQMARYGEAANNILSPLASLGYASVLILAVKLGALRFVTNALANVGRMALTNYLTQSLIMTTIFYGGRGLGLYGEVDRVTLWAIVVSIWVLQLIWSPLWLKRFQMGPFEWLWRRLSYARPVALYKERGSSDPH